MNEIKITRYSQGDYIAGGENYIADVENLGQMWGFDRYEITFYLEKYCDLELLTSVIVETTEYSVVTNHIKQYFKEQIKSAVNI